MDEYLQDMKVLKSSEVIRCKAAVAWEFNQPLVIEEVEVAPPQEKEIRIKIVATGVCQSDLYFLCKCLNQTMFPAVFGHEAAGVVESIGPGVTEFQPGDTVIPLFMPQCRECRLCKSPKTNLCVNGSAGRIDERSFERSRISCRGRKLLQFLGTSSFSEFTVVKEISVAKIDPAAPLDKVCLIGCAICTGYGAAVNTAKVEAGSSCAVFGLGAVGLAAVMGCRAAAASRIIAVDINPEKFEKAKVLGATDVVNPNDHSRPIQQVIQEMTGGGVDFSFECIGNVEVMRGALESCAAGWGVSVIAGWTDMQNFSAPPIQLMTGRKWTGTLFGGFKGKDGVAQMVRAYLDRKLMVDEFITHNLRLDQVNEAVELMKNGRCVRAVLSVAPQ
ncbi:alcohol dehydrogenase 1-like isoform X2 [Xiphophorus hellerii]|uniref:alcohol dehydrogenase 1-like isoform X2 n=1 Tax=Xiphophorus hellerii TaxID=8084 RepID=UPI0013B36CE9|nr:alcohol dehydrogenase 1-like isoform X2 [Xiphophorus hellerii]